MGNKVNKKSFLFLAGTLGQGGAEKQLFLMTQSLKNNGHQVSVITFGKNEFWEEYFLRENVNLLYCNFKNKFLRFNYLFKTVAKLKPDYFYSIHFFTSSYTGFVCLFFNSVMSIGSIRNNGRSELKLNGFLSFFHMHLPNLVISNNKFGADYINRNLFLRKGKIKILNNSIIKSDTYASIYSKDKPLKLLFVGRLHKDKNPQMFIDICKLIFINKIIFTADIFGTGELYDVLQTQIKNYNLTDFVKLRGSYPDVQRKMSEYHLLISTSNYEGTPNVLLESFVSSLPVFSVLNNASYEILSVKYNLPEFIFNDLLSAKSLILKFIEKPELYYKKIKDLNRKIISEYNQQSQYYNLLAILEN